MYARTRGSFVASLLIPFRKWSNQFWTMTLLCAGFSGRTTTKRLVERERAAREPRRERLALEVGMTRYALPSSSPRSHIAPTCGWSSLEMVRLTREPGPELRIVRETRRQDLDGDGTVEARVPRAVHLAHPACPELREDLVRPDHGANQHRAMA